MELDKIKYEFPDEQTAQQAFEQARQILSVRFFMENVCMLDGLILTVPGWFPFTPKHGKKI